MSEIDDLTDALSAEHMARMAAEAENASLRAVIEKLHHPETRYSAVGCEEFSLDTREEALEYGDEVYEFTVCAHCGQIETGDNGDRAYRDSMWPCATARILAAVPGNPETTDRETER